MERLGSERGTADDLSASNLVQIECRGIRKEKKKKVLPKGVHPLE